MKFNFILFLSLIITLHSCQSNEVKKPIVAENPIYKEIQVDISGMTCEIGCAKLIESKLIKTPGVDKVDVVFTDSIGYIRYDINQVDQKKLVEVIEKTGGGELYRVKEVHSIESTQSAE
jgi:copper chaperone CopZ